MRIGSLDGFLSSYEPLIFADRKSDNFNSRIFSFKTI